MSISESLRRTGMGVACVAALIILSPAAPAQTPPTPELPRSMQSGAPIQFELWSWGEDEAGRQKIRDLKDGDRIPLERLPESVQFRFRIPKEHNGVTFRGRSTDGEHKLGWAEDSHGAFPLIPRGSGGPTTRPSPE